MQSFILAGGFATRLWPLTESRAKPLLPLAGKPILSHLLEKIPEDLPVTVSTNAAFAEGFHTWQQSISRPVRILVEPTRGDREKTGALGAVAQWIRDATIAEDILLLAGDNVLGFPLAHVLREYRPGTPIFAAVAVASLAQASQLGVVIPEEERDVRRRTQHDTSKHHQDTLIPYHVRLRAKGFVEKPPHPPSPFVSTGCLILPQKHLSRVVAFAREHPDNIGGILTHFIAQGVEVDYVVYPDLWFDIGSFESYLAATKAIVGNRISLQPQASVDATSRTSGSVVVGARSCVTRSALENTVLFEDCIVDDCVLHDCIVDDRCRLKGVELTGKMLRAGTVLELS